MDAPICEANHIYEVTTKASQKEIVFTTVFIKSREVAWPCAELATHATQSAGCAARHGVLRAHGAQCSCLDNHTVYSCGHRRDDALV
jgi:hypothetical protein